VQQSRDGLKKFLVTHLINSETKKMNLKAFCNDISDIAQTVIVIRDVTDSFEVVEKLVIL
jgi:hypothetical protein